MSDPTLGELIDNRVNYLIDQLPVNQEVVVTGTYDDNYVDVKIKNNNELMTYVPTNVLGNIGEEGVLIFLNGDIKQPFCLLGAVTEDKDLKEYVKKKDVKLKIDLEDNGTIIFGLDIGDGF